ncbi:sex peptide receptor-like [Planococcus citri]|uniref:sex peptide receptor-like n=1 Tax=Planococcus citri TaxID=170843 RepID=UPI0031F77EF5
MSTEASYCPPTLLKIGRYYEVNMHVPSNIIICFFGAVSNLLNLLVFTRKPMISPPNLIFTHLALVDFLDLLARFLSAGLKCMYYHDPETQLTYWWAVFRIWYNALTATAHFMSVFLTVLLTLRRYIAVVYPLKERQWCSMKITRNVVIAGYIMCIILLGVPTYLSREIVTTNVNQTITYKSTYEKSPIMHGTSSIVKGVIGRLVPAVVLTWLTYRLIVILIARKTHQEQLTQSATVGNQMKTTKMKQQINRSTTILFTVVALFFIAEFPKGILSLLRMIYNEKATVIRKECFTSLQTIFQSITNFNISITFVVYYTLSHQFRSTFRSMFSCNNSVSNQKQTTVVSEDIKETDVSCTKTDAVQ